MTWDPDGDVPPTVEQARELEGACVTEVARLKAAGVEPIQRAALTAEMREMAGRARAALFGHVTQGKGKPMTYGHGSRERYLKETKG